MWVRERERERVEDDAPYEWMRECVIKYTKYVCVCMRVRVCVQVRERERKIEIMRVINCVWQREMRV